MNIRKTKKLKVMNLKEFYQKELLLTKVNDRYELINESIDKFGLIAIDIALGETVSDLFIFDDSEINDFKNFLNDYKEVNHEYKSEQRRLSNIDDDELFNQMFDDKIFHYGFKMNEKLYVLQASKTIDI